MERWREQPSRFECVINLHPRQATLIRRLLVSNGGFRELCDDYVLLCEMTAELDAGIATGHPEVRAEYARLATELEQEIARALAKLASSPV